MCKEMFRYEFFTLNLLFFGYIYLLLCRSYHGHKIIISKSFKFSENFLILHVEVYVTVCNKCST